MKTRSTLLAIAAFVLTTAAFAQTTTNCTPGANQPLPRIPEIVRDDAKNVLRGTIIVSAEQQNIATRVPNSAPTPTSCWQFFPQWVRVIRGVNTVPAMPTVAAGKLPDPMPGPTLRARLGDLVQITFLNQIDPGVFPYSIDQGDKQRGCDEVSNIYPGTPPNADTFPNCFHGSSTANIHFHGSHVNPNSTGDNVFVEVRPSLRTKDEANKPIVTQASVKEPFDEFFSRCAIELQPANPLKQWPRTWNDLPSAWTERQEELLKQYDETLKDKSLALWPVDREQRALGNWPQYYIGAYPYCFRIPQYTQSAWPPKADPQQTHQHGAGTAEKKEPESDRPLMMGQAPGLHWYHAHKHGSTAINVSNGMTGAFVIEGPYDDELDAWYGKGWMRQQPVMVINQLGVSPNLERPKGTGRQDKGPDFSVNGRLRPVVTMRPGEVQMFRIVNTSGRAGAYFAAPPAGFQWMQLAQDGVQFADVNYKASLNRPFLLASGNRGDFLVKAPDDPTPSPVPVTVQYEVDPSDLPSAAPNILFSINVKGKPATGNNAQFIPSAPAFPPFLADIEASEVKGTKKLVFASAAPTLGKQHTIDGKQFGGEVGEVVLLNSVEEWKVMNATYGPLISHPFHIHVNPFQIVEVFNPNETIPGTTTPRYVFDGSALQTGQCAIDLSADPDSWKPCAAASGPPAKNRIWWDVFPIPSGKQVKKSDGTTVNVPGYFKMRSRFVDYHGYYVLHCHILAHEDRGMMTIVEVAPLRSPYSHH